MFGGLASVLTLLRDSKMLSHLKAAVALRFAFYDLCRVQALIRVIPAVRAGAANHVWSLNELAA